MLPESSFPVTGGIMQTEEVVPRAHSIDIDGSLTDISSYEHSLHLPQRLHCQLPGLIHMAVKQEPQEDDERAGDVKTLRSTSNEALNSQQAEASTAPTPTEVAHHVLHGHETTVHQRMQQGTEAVLGTTNQDSVNRSRPSRGRRKSRWKLKFHHQALPPEYLDHYEAALAQETLNTSPTHGYESIASSPATSTATSISAQSPVSESWLQRMTAMQQELCPQTSPNPIDASQTNNRRSVITSTTNNYSGNHSNTQNHQPPPRPPMKYSDLPYMGEITLDNSKPRRGRKPKKADICHLIYKNYGTILPGTPGHEDHGTELRERQENHREHPPHVSFQRSEIQNRISSLLEKRLTQESKKGSLNPDNPKEQEEPLNLCIKDLNQLKIRLLRKHGNIYESGHVKSEASSDAEDIECLELKKTHESSPVDPIRSIEFLSNIANNNNQNVLNNNTKNINHNEPTDPNSGFVYWPNTGVFIHPMALQSQFLYYQKMSQGEKNLTKPDAPSSKEPKIVPKSIFSMIDPKSPTPSPSSTVSSPPAVSPRPKRLAPSNQQSAQPTKRKRSAIFIPPMPTENNNNPATEVSICKFKFTGGAKPSLQEKKSLSVDSGGNFRYYSGTGDKSMRGYEFFPRESLQQPAGQATSSAGAFLSAAGERIPPPLVCQRPVVPDDGRRKRKTRKSLQREKLEQTFKEKGFLIQTQQLESAEGATYCKFRQLRKFTRYLFRSWKDYLPGNVRDLSQVPEDENIDTEIEGEQSISPISNPDIVAMSNVLEEHQTLPLT